MNWLDRLENWLANKAANAMMEVNAVAPHKATISAIVIRKNGKREDLGVISETEVSPYKVKSFKQIIKDLWQGKNKQ